MMVQKLLKHETETFVLNLFVLRAGFLLHGQQRDQDGRLVSRRVQAKRTRHDAQVPSPQRKPAVGVRLRGEWKNE